MLKQLELNYFKKHEKLSVNFTAGLNGITGPNYKGKSTILLGILFCLGGSRMVPGSRVATRGTNSGFKQTLWFEIPGKGDYMVQRTKTSANLHNLTEDGTHLLVASGTTPVNNAIAELLGMPLRRFAQIKYAKQRAADAILKYGSGELFKIVTELTGLERIMAVQELLDNDLKAHRHIMEHIHPVDVQSKRDELVLLQEWLALAQASLGELSTDVFRANDAVEAAEVEERRLSKARNAVLEAQREVRYANQTMDSCGKRYQAVQDRLTCFQIETVKLRIGTRLDSRATVVEQEQACVGLEARIATLTESKKTLAENEKAVRAIDVEVATLTRQCAELVDGEDKQEMQVQLAVNVLHSLPESDPDELERIAQELDDLKVSRPELAHQAKHAQAVLKNGVCGTCERPMDDFDPEQAAITAGSYAASLAALDAQIAEVESRWDECDGRLRNRLRCEDELRRKTNALNDYREHASKLRRSLAQKSIIKAGMPPADNLKASLDATVEELDHVRQLLRNMQGALAEMKVAEKDIDVAVEAHTKALGHYSDVLEEYAVESPEQVAELLEHQQKHLDYCRAQFGEMSNRREKDRQDANLLETKVALLEQEITLAEVSNEKHETARRKVLSMEQLRDLIRGNRDRYSRQVWDVFMASATLFASTITGGYVESVSRGSDGAFTFFEEGHEMAMEEASGAQQALIGCAVQMALAEAAQCPLDVILMDEPTADMDPEHALAFSTLLAASGKQVIMVTHRELDSTVFHHSIAL